MHTRQSKDGPIFSIPSLADKAASFPGPVPIASVPPDGSRLRWGGEDLDGRPWALHVTYRRDGHDVLEVRTVRGSLDWTPVFETIEDLSTLMTDERLSEPPVSETPTTVTIDGVPVAGTRIDRPDRSGIQVDWQGQHVYCLGDPDLVDAVELRTGTREDFAAIDAAGAAYRAQLRAEWQD